MQSELTEKGRRFLAAAKTALETGGARTLVLSRPADPALVKWKCERRRDKEKILYVAETFLADGKDLQKNFRTFPEETLEKTLPLFFQADLIGASASAEYKRSKKGSEYLRLPAALTEPGGERAEIPSLSRQKNRLLDGSEPFLRELGVADREGRVLPSRQAKFRQICRFLEFLRDVLPALPETGPLTVYDLCCGKCYLSFAVYHYLANALGRDVSMLCVDRKRDMTDLCEAAARRLGFSGMRFLAADIRELPEGGRPDLVLSLHACDTATDTVLETAVRLGAAAILSTPCCQRELSRAVSCPPLSFALRHGVLSDKICASLTDALRVLYLEANGYETAAAELIDPDDTPKNVILRAVLKPNEKKKSAAAREYREACAFLGVLPRL
ncbi:MAG: SAM-dependent methyltransferase [Clostridia bacterium]|nr:SAM-dependent methyltransferase [Clostridia bacterium]